MFTYSDQLKNKIILPEKAKRIISIVPSQSELLWDLGLKDELVGITKYCVHPQQMFETIAKVGGTKRLDINKIRELKPDLIIGNKEENDKQQIEILQREFNIWMSDIYNFKDAFNMIGSLGEIFDKKAMASDIIGRITASLENIKNIFQRQSVAYFIWRKPFMVAASHTFIDHVLNHIGATNALSHLDRYPELTNEDLMTAKPDLCFLSSEPFPFTGKHVRELKKILPASKILIVDGEMFSWYGSRLTRLESYILELKEEIEGG